MMKSLQITILKSPVSVTEIKVTPIGAWSVGYLWESCVLDATVSLEKKRNNNNKVAEKVHEIWENSFLSIRN